MKKELINHKFKKLSDANKIRYNIGKTFFIQKKTALIIMVWFLIIMGYLFLLPFIIRYGGLYKILGYAIFGSILLFIAFILAWIELFRTKNDEKVLEKFLNEKSKK